MLTMLRDMFLGACDLLAPYVYYPAIYRCSFCGKSEAVYHLNVGVFDWVNDCYANPRAIDDWPCPCCGLTAASMTVCHGEAARAEIMLPITFKAITHMADAQEALSSQRR